MRALKGLLIVAGVFAIAGVLSGCPGGKTVAVVNGRRIPEEDVMKRVSPGAKATALIQIIMPMLVEREAAKAGVRASDEELKAILDRNIKAVGGPEKLDQILKEQGLTRQEVTEILRVQLLIDKIRTRQVRVTDDQLRKYFQEHQDQWGEPAEVKVHEIMVDSRETAQAIHDQVAGVQSPSAQLQKFGELARDKSTGLYRGQGGDRGWMKAAQLPPSVKDRVLALSAGQLSDPLEVDYGVPGAKKSWALYYVEDKKPAVPARFEDVRFEVEREVKDQDPAAEPPSALQQRLIRNAHIEIVAPEYEPLKQQLAIMQGGPGGPEGPRGPSAPARPPAAPPGAGKPPAPGGAAPSKTPASPSR